MRIISGKFKGKTLHPGKNFKARPTTDFAKEGLFNILANIYNFQYIEILDLFSGTGSISFEFASRECFSCEAVELDYNHYKYIHKTAKELNFSQIIVYRMDAFRFIKNCSKKYDIIFADPPYDMEGVEKIPILVLDKLLLKQEGIFILEHSKKINFNNNKNLRDHRTYGSVNFSIFS